jgi:hypothetical protein
MLPSERPQIEPRPNAPCRAHLDCGRTFATVRGEAWCRFEQDGKKFGQQGVEILTNDVGDDAAKHQPKNYNAAVSKKSRSVAAERMRRTRERRRAGIIAVVGVEITKRDVEQFVGRNLLSRGDAHDREKIAIAVRQSKENRLRSDH